MRRTFFALGILLLGCAMLSAQKLEPVVPPLKKTELFPQWTFRPGTTELTARAASSLNEFATRLRAYPDSVVEIRVFQIYQGGDTAAYLTRLQTQSQVIVDYLVGQGVSLEQVKQLHYIPEAMEIHRHGEQDFTQNRPVEAHLLN